MDTKKSRMLALLACLFVLFTNHVQAQDNDELQRLIDRVASAPITRAEETVREIDLSPYTEPRTTTLYIRNGANVRFVNGTLTREKNLNEPLVEIQGDSKLELASSATLKGEGPLSPIVLISAGELVVKGGVIDGMPYEESKVTNDTRRRTKSDSYSYPPGEPIYVYRIASSVSIVAESGSSFIMESGTLTSSVINSGNNMLQITGGTIADISTSLSDVFIGGTVNINQVKLLGNSRIGLVSHITEELPIKDVSSGESAVYGYGYTLTTYDLDNVWFIDDYKPVLANNTITAEEWGKNRVVSYRKPGHLAYMSEGNQEITETLSLAGKVNGDDIAMIRNIGNKALKTLDLSHASIVSGGGNYYTKQRPIPPGFYVGVFTYDRYYTENDTISFHMFGDLEKLESISLPVGVRVIEDEAFQNCKNLQKLTETSNHLQVIAGSAFNGCTSLKEFNLRYNPNLILDDGVVYDNNMTKVHAALPAMVSGAYSFPSSIKEINAKSFKGCTGLTNINMEESTITTIQNNTFSGCSALSDVELPQCVAEIESNAFWGCNISNITLPMSLTEIATGAFGNNDINEIHNNSVYPPSIYQFKPNNDIIDSYDNNMPGSFEGTDTLTCKVYVPNESIASYKAAVGWKSFKCYFGNISNPNHIESEDDLQKRLDEIAAENPSEPVELTIAEEGIDIGFVYASAGCNAKITGGPIRVKNVNNGGDYAYAVYNGAKLTFKDITLDFGNKYQRYATFLVKGDLTIGHDVTFQNIYQGSEQTKGFFVTSNAKLNIYSGDITAYGSIVNSTSESKVYIMGGTLKSTSNDPTITGDASVFMRGGSVIGGNKFVIMVNYVIRISEFAKVKGESGATLIDAKSTYIEGGTLEGSNTYSKSGTIGTPQSVPKVLIDRIYVYGQNIVYGNVDLPMLYMNNDAKIQLASSISKTWTINGDWKQFDITEPYTIVSGYNYYNYTVTKADYSKMQFANLPDDMEAVYNEDLKVVQIQKREVECDLQSLVDGLCDAAPGGNVPAPTDGVDIGCDDAPDPLQCAVDIIIDGGEENVNPNDLKTICLCQAGPDVVIEKPAIRVNPYSTLTISNYNIRSDKYENQSFLVRGTLIIDVNVHIYHFIRFIHIKPGGRVVWRGGHVEDVDEIVYNEGGTLVIEGDFDNGGKCFVNPEGGTLTIKNGSFNGNIENHGTLIIEGGEITGKVDNSGTFTMTGGVVSNTVVNSTEVVFKNYGTFYFKGGIIGGYGSSLIYHAKGAVLRIEGGQFDFSHVTDYWIEAHDDFYFPGNYDFKPTVPMLIEPKVIVRVLYKWIYKFNIVFVGGLPEPRHPLFCGNDFTLTKDHFKFIDWQLPNKRWRWHLNVTDNTIEPRDEEVEDEDDLQAYLNWLAENQQDESASTDANPQVLDLQERIITITEPIVLPVGSHVFFKNGRFAPKSAWSSDRVFYVPSGSSLKMENVVVDMSSSIHYVVSGKTVCRYIFDVAGNLHFGLGCKIKGYVNKNYLPTDTYIPGAALRIAPTAHLYLDGGQIDDVVICVNSVVNIYLTVNLVYNIYFYIPTACRTNGFRILAPYNSYSLTAADMKKLLMFGALEWGAQADVQGYASLYKITYNVGDADGNGEIDIEDASAILNYIIGKPVPESFVLSAADVNKDEKVDILDVTSLIKMLLKKP